MSFIEQLQKFIEGKNSSNKNIRTSDNKLAYITSTGIAKPYASVDSYEKTSGQHGCPRSYLSLSEKWDTLGYAPGSQMQTGQSCGKEGTFLQSGVPSTKFDVSFYLSEHPELKDQGIMNEKQAYEHWKTTGIGKGWSPNADFNKEIQHLGKVGYIDLDTQLHVVSNDAYVYDGYYNASNTHITGRSMLSCNAPVPLIKYGLPILLKKENEYASVNQTNVVFGNSKKTWYLHPMDILNKNNPVLYGDQVVLSDMDICADNCTVGYYNKDTHSMMVGPAKKGNTFYLLPPPNTPYALKSAIKYGDPFIIQYTPLETEYEYTDLELGIDTGGNDIKSFKNITRDACKQNCEETTDCAGYVYAPSGNTCWLKTKKMYPLGSSKYNLNSNRQITIRTQILPKKASVQNGSMVFQDSGDMFIAMPPTDTLNLKCDLSDLQKQCNMKGKECIGFVHSPETNTWQTLSPNPIGSITVGEEKNIMYLKQAKASLQGCPNQTEWIDSSQFSHYVQGEEFKSNQSGQCKPVDISELSNNAKEFKAKSEEWLKQGAIRIQEYNQLNQSTNDTYNQLSQQYTKGEEQLNEYRSVKKSIKHLKKNPTIPKSVEDTVALDNYYRKHTIIWTVGAVAVVFLVVAAKKL